MAAPNIDFTSLDFDDISTDLINYITANSTFTDANKSGSNLNLLVKLLAYITTLLSYNLNEAISEEYIGTVELRENMLKIIKILNYAPHRATSSYVTVDLSEIVKSSTPAFLLTYDKIASNGLNFYYTGSDVETPGTTLSEVKFYEGALVNNQSAFFGDGTDFQSFVIADTGVGDYFKLFKVNNDNTRTYWDVFNEGTIYVSPATQMLYFIEEVETGYKISFGNGKLGIQPQPGETFGYEYLKPTQTSETNLLVDYQWVGGGTAAAINSAFVNGHITGATVVVNSTISPNGSLGGGAVEDVETIRYNAPKFYQSQARAVNESDYIALALRNPLIQKVEVIGGDKLTPLQLGKVFITAKANPDTYPFDNFTDVDLDSLVDYFDPYKVVTIRPIVRNPTYIHLVLSVLARYTAESAIPAASAITTALLTFINTENSDFGDYLEFSRLQATVDNSDKLITSNLTTMLLYTTLQELWLLPDPAFRFQAIDSIYDTTQTGATRKTYIEVWSEIATGGPGLVTTLYEGVDYTIAYGTDGYIKISNYGTGQLNNFEDEEYRFYHYSIDDDVFLNASAGQIFLLKEEELTITTQRVSP